MIYSGLRVQGLSFRVFFGLEGLGMGEGLEGVHSSHKT